MNTIVNKLLDVDREARQMLDEAQQYYERTLAEIEDEKKGMREEYSEKARLHLEALEAELNEEVEEATAGVRARTATLLKAMEEHYDRHHEEWVVGLVQRAIHSSEGNGAGDRP